MLRQIMGMILGLIAWGVIVTVLNFGLRNFLPGYAGVEKAMTFTLTMMIARLAISAISSLAGGFVAAWAGNGGWAALGSGLILLLLFLPVHYSLWHTFPIWYHLTFLTSLPLLGWAGGKIQTNGRQT